MDYTKYITKNLQYRQVINSLINNKLNHAYLLKSADSDYINQICLFLASKIAPAEYCQVSKHTHPDVFIYGENGKIDVSNVTEIIENLNTRPYSSEKKVYCLLNIENMNETSQNKILKSIEEPPKDVVFLLTTSSSKNILPTILSRVTSLDIDNLKNDEILALLVDSGIRTDVAQIAVNNAGGNSTLALKLTNQSFVELYHVILDMLENVNGSKDCLNYVSKLDNKNVDKEEVLDTTILIVRDVSMAICGEHSLIVSQSDISVIERMSKMFSLEATVNIIKECLLLKEDLYYNTNNTAVMDKLVLTIAREKSKCKK